MLASVSNIGFTRALSKPSFKGNTIYIPNYQYEDTFSYSKDYKLNSSNEINKRLNKLYGIKSDIKNPEILKNLEPAIKDFCEINKNNKMFKGLNISEKPMDSLFGCNVDLDKNKFNLIFNSDFDWNNLENYTKGQYDNALASSKNKNFYLYKGLAEFLLFKDNPEKYLENNNGEFSIGKKDYGRLRKICTPSSFGDFHSSYIAKKMSADEAVPDVLTKFFNIKNDINLKFPLTEFTSPDEVQKYLKENYGIKSDFKTLEYAKSCLEAVEDLTKATGDNNIFNGLEIKTMNKPDKYDPNSPAWVHTINDLKISRIELNPNYETAQQAQNKFNNCINSSNTIKSTFTHELSHWLQFEADKDRYLDISNKFKSGELSFSENMKRIANRVSYYATQEPLEFCAEYIAGRMDGFKYPKQTDIAFNKLWWGPKINFPD